MPDLDHLPKGFLLAWRSVADAIRGRQQPTLVGDAIEKALARTLRKAGGLPEAPELAEAIRRSCVLQSIQPLERAIESLDVARAGGIVAAVVDAAWALVATGDGDGTSSPDLDVLAELSLERMIQKLCLGPLEPNLVPAIFASVAELRAYYRACVSEVDLHSFVEQLARSGYSGRVHAPRTRLHRLGTRELLHAPLL
ncbi:MAG: hypothetical protein ACYCZN_10265 [Candidatus Dormibacteria bacterium]